MSFKFLADLQEEGESESPKVSELRKRLKDLPIVVFGSS